MEGRTAVFSPVGSDFEAFPPTVKRKYFSTLERLRYAQGQMPVVEPPKDVRPKSSGTPKQKSAHFSRPSIFGLRPATKHAKEPCKELPQREVSQEESEWYQALPEKIKRNHFTFEERHFYSTKDERPVVDVTEEMFYRLGGRHANRSLPSLSSASHHRSDSGSTFDEAINTPLDMHDAVYDSFKMLESYAPVDAGLDDYHQHRLVESAAVPAARVSPDPLPAVKRNRALTASSSAKPRPSLDRGKSLSDMAKVRRQQAHEVVEEALPPRSASFSSSLHRSGPSVSSKKSLFERRRSRHLSMSHDGHDAEDTPPVPAIDLEATHVSDPATRLKLKLYLGSAAKFDEAVEFGFPALERATPPPSATSLRRPSSSHSRSRPPLSASVNAKRESTAIGTTFFMDDDDEGDEASKQPNEVEEEMDERSTVHDASGLAARDSDATAVEDDIHVFAVELPADPVPAVRLTGLSKLKITTTPTADWSKAMSPPAASTHLHRRSHSVSLLPKTGAKNSLASPTVVAVPQSARLPRDGSLRPWMDFKDFSGEREMTLRMTLTRKDLRADESLIYPDGGAGSWDSPTADSPARGSDSKWRFWQRRR